ncbi:MAG: glycoside hydrolase family 55 protein, partial [Armatimonadetes bacterium]|nr:glycoside hydrolase family 55 protein [Armatimonadota bacterium]
MRILLLVLAFVALIGGAAHCAPAVFWASDPIAPGETVLLVGGGFGDTPKIEVKRIPDGPAGQPAVPSLGWSGGGETVPTIQPSDTAVKFTLPTALKPGLFAVRVTGPDGAVTQLLNGPALWWLQGDLGLAASPGSTLRLFGKNLLWKDGPKPTVVLEGPAKLSLTPTGDAYALSCALPANLAPGTYRVSVHGGHGGSVGWSAPVDLTVEKRPAWPARVFNVREHGAVGDGATDDTGAIQTALDAAGQAGGGVVFFPRGRYQLQQALTIPRFVVLRGEGEDLVSVFWPDMDAPPPVLLQGTNSFGLEELTLYCSNYKTFLAADTSGPDAGDVFLRKVRVRADVFRGHMKPEEVDRRWREGLKVGFGGGYWLLKLGGRNLSVTDCDLYSASCIYALTQPRGAVIERNILGAGRWGGSGIFGGEGVILADNQYVGMDLMSWGAAGGLGFGNLSHLYLARNSFKLEHGGDRESITSDASGGIYYGPIKSCAGTTLTLPEAIKAPDQRWIGSGVFVLDGKGHGQWRRAVGYDGDKIEVDRPWDIPPDSTSAVSVVWLLRQWLLLDNSFSDVGISIQLYGSALEHICAGNTTARSAGFHNFGMNYHGIQPSWYIQWLGNEITEGNAYSAGHDNYMLAG